MLVRRAEDIDGRPMDIPGVHGVTMRILVGRDDGAPTFAMRHYTVEPGGHTPHHQHDYEHEVMVLEGAARVECDGEKRTIRAGDVVYVPANALHQFVNEGPDVLEFICLVPVTFDCGKPTPGT